MRWSKELVMPILAIMVGVSMIVGAGAIVRLSNVMNNDNTVGLPVAIQIVSTTATPGGDLPDYASGMLSYGVTYDMLVTYSTTKNLDNARIVAQFTKIGINTTDVQMNWWDGAAWHSIAWLKNGDVLNGTLGAVGSQGAGGTVNYPTTLAYQATGEFNFKLWVEGSVT